MAESPPIWEGSLEVDDGLTLQIRRYYGGMVHDTPLPSGQGARQPARSRELLKALKERKATAGSECVPVLLLHGASAGRQTFEFPRGASFVDFLLRYTNLEPWLLDWRCSKNVTDPYLRVGSRFDSHFTYDQAAEIDIPAAAKRIRAEYPASVPLRIVGHCMGAESLSRALSLGRLNGDSRPDRIVLSAIGLFYEVAVDGRLKAEEHMLERLRASDDRAAREPQKWAGAREDFVDPRCDASDNRAPRNRWPSALEELYEKWPAWFKVHRDPSATDAHSQPERSLRGDARAAPRHPQHIIDMCNRVSFMFGEPYYEPALHPQIHESPTELIEQFGLMPLPMYVHAAQCVRRRWAARFDAGPEDRKLIGAQARRQFDDIDVLTITGAMNRLWHRDSIDRMYEWLKRDEGRGRGRYHKIIFRKNGHQDLFWGTNSWHEIFPEIADHLTR